MLHCLIIFGRIVQVGTLESIQICIDNIGGWPFNAKILPFIESHTIGEPHHIRLWNEILSME